MGEDSRPSTPRSQALTAVLESAARLQELIPDAGLVGGAAAALHAGHRDFLDHDHDHALVDLVDRFGAVLEAVSASDGWATSVRASRPPVTLMGSLDGIRAGVRQLRRTRPLETCRVEVPPGHEVTVPTFEEMLRIKAYLVLERNQVRDYLDVVALADRIGHQSAVQVLSGIDDYYDDRSGEHGSVLTGVTLALSDPAPQDTAVLKELPRYRGLDPRWHDWSTVVNACADLAVELVGDH